LIHFYKRSIPLIESKMLGKCLWLSAGLVMLAVADQDAVRRLKTAEPGNWTVDNCIVLKMSAQITLMTEREGTNITVEMVVPPEAEASGHCGGNKNTSTQQINLSWEEKDPDMTKLTFLRTLNITFAKNTTLVPPVYGVQKIQAYYETRHYIVSENMTDDNGTVVVKNTTQVEYISMTSPTYTRLEFQTPLNRSFLCLDVGALELFAEINTSETPRAAGERLPNNATFTALKVQLDAFRAKDIPSNVLQSPLDCSFRPSDVVPIVVGCALAGTVLLVLIAYLCGRRRSAARGYQSV